MKSSYPALLLGLVLPLLAAGAEPNRSWDELRNSVKIGSNVVVTRMSGGKVEGRLLAIAADSITVRLHGQPEVVPQPQVFRVRYANIRRGNTLAAMVVGAGVGAVLGIFAGGENYRAEGAALLGGMGTGIGAAVGGVMPIGKPLYESERPRRALTPSSPAAAAGSASE